MADNNKRKIADPIDLHEDYPFAELTRIMGFDPRLTKRAEPVVEAAQPVATPTPHPVIAPVAIHPVAVEPAIEAAEHDEFGIDLEKELMGEFADFEPELAAAEQPAPAAPVSQPEGAVDIAIEDDFEDAFTARMPAGRCSGCPWSPTWPRA